MIAAAVLLEPAQRDDVRERALKLVGDRQRPFHWKDEGIEKRVAMIDLLGDFDVCVFAVIHYPVLRQRQVAARRKSLGVLASAIGTEGVDELVIGSRDLQDHEDRVTLINAMQTGQCPPLDYSFAGKGGAAPVASRCCGGCAQRS